MQIQLEADFGISDENSVAAPPSVNRKRKRMSKPRGSKADKWPDDDTSILIHILHDDARNYGFNGSTINAPRWRGIIDEFWSKSDKKDIYDEQQIKSKHGRLRTETKNFKELLQSCSGYGWDPVTNTVTCPSDIWAAHVSKKKDKNVNISKYRYKGLEHFDLLREIFGKSFATGKHVVYSTAPDSPQQSNEATRVDKEPFSCDDIVDSIGLMHVTSSGTGTGKHTINDPSMATDDDTSICRKKGRATTMDNIHESLEKHLKWKRERAEAKEKKKEHAQVAKDFEIDIYSEQVVISQLQFIMGKFGIEDKQFSLAVPHLRDPSFRKMFVHMAEKWQIQWIKGLE